MFTPQERNVARLTASGYRNAQIAEVLGCSRGNVSSILGNIYKKLSLKSRIALIAYVGEHPEEFSATGIPFPNIRKAAKRGVDKKELKNFDSRGVRTGLKEDEIRDFISAEVRAFLGQLQSFLLYEAAKVIDAVFPPVFKPEPRQKKEPPKPRLMSLEEIRALCNRINAKKALEKIEKQAVKDERAYTAAEEWRKRMKEHCQGRLQHVDSKGNSNE